MKFVRYSYDKSSLLRMSYSTSYVYMYMTPYYFEMPLA